MARKFSEQKLVVASHNPGKVKEIAELLDGFGFEVVSAGDLDLPEPEETETTFTGNAELKARAAAEASGLPALADDSGLAVAALSGAPGIYSARWAGPDKDFSLAMGKINDAFKLLEELGEPAPLDMAFICALSICWPDGHVETVEGRVEGTFAWPPRGDKGFGYDPIFQPIGQIKTFGEIEPAAKHAVSHRADAFRKLIRLCLE